MYTFYMIKQPLSTIPNETITSEIIPMPSHALCLCEKATEERQAKLYFFIVIRYTFQRSIFTLYCLLIYKHISGLHIDDTIVLDGNEINLLYPLYSPHILHIHAVTDLDKQDSLTNTPLHIRIRHRDNF